jgi:hypothetical protein
MRIVVQPAWTKNKKLSSKLTTVERDGGLTQVLEHLPSKPEAELQLQYHQNNIKNMKNKFLFIL